MTKAEELMARWDNLNAEIEEFTCISEILDYVLHQGGDADDQVTLHISGAMAFIKRYINDMSTRYTNLLEEVKPFLK